MQNFPSSYLYRRIVAAKLFIDKHFSEPLPLDLVADEACFSKFHFIRLFKKVYGHTPHQYLIRVRIAEAKKLLSNGAPVCDVGYAVGFESPGSFCGLFRKKTGMTPARYQQLRRDIQRRQKAAPLHFIPDCFARVNGWKD